MIIFPCFSFRFSLSHILSKSSLGAVSSDKEMTVPNLSPSRFHQQVLASLPRLYQEKTFSDVTLVSQEQAHHQAHRVVLCSVSPVLKSILEGLACVQSPVIFLKGVRGEDLESVLHFIYNGTLVLSRDRVDCVLQLLRDFQLDEVFDINESKEEKISETSEKEIPDGGNNDLETPNEDSNEEQEKKQKKELKEAIFLKCEFCDYTTNRRVSLKNHTNVRHLNIRSSFPCQECDKVLGSKGALNLHVEVKHRNTTYHCDYEGCDVTAKSKTTINFHKESKHQGIQYMCDQCDHKTSKKVLLKKHMTVMHGKDFLNCPDCDYKTKWRPNLKNHIQIQHEGLRHICKYCGFKATRADNLRVHIKTIHTEPRLLCSCCPFKANTRRQLDDHILKVHKVL